MTLRSSQLYDSYEEDTNTIYGYNRLLERVYRTQYVLGLMHKPFCVSPGPAAYDNVFPVDLKPSSIVFACMTS